MNSDMSIQSELSQVETHVETLNMNQNNSHATEILIGIIFVALSDDLIFHTGRSLSFIEYFVLL